MTMLVLYEEKFCVPLFDRLEIATLLDTLDQSIEVRVLYYLFFGMKVMFVNVLNTGIYKQIIIQQNCVVIKEAYINIQLVYC